MNPITKYLKTFLILATVLSFAGSTYAAKAARADEHFMTRRFSDRELKSIANEFNAAIIAMIMNGVSLSDGRTYVALPNQQKTKDNAMTLVLEAHEIITRSASRSSLESVAEQFSVIEGRLVEKKIAATTFGGRAYRPGCNIVPSTTESFLLQYLWIKPDAKDDLQVYFDQKFVDKLYKVFQQFFGVAMITGMFDECCKLIDIGIESFVRLEYYLEKPDGDPSRLACKKLNMHVEDKKNAEDRRRRRNKKNTARKRRNRQRRSGANPLEIDTSREVWQCSLCLSLNPAGTTACSGCSISFSSTTAVPRVASASAPVATTAVSRVASAPAPAPAAAPAPAPAGGNPCLESGAEPACASAAFVPDNGNPSFDV